MWDLRKQDGVVVEVEGSEFFALVEGSIHTKRPLYLGHGVVRTPPDGPQARFFSGGGIADPRVFNRADHGAGGQGRLPVARAPARPRRWTPRPAAPGRRRSGLGCHRRQGRGPSSEGSRPSPAASRDWSSSTSGTMIPIGPLPQRERRVAEEVVDCEELRVRAALEEFRLRRQPGVAEPRVPPVEDLLE